jgi:hypothetical protein
MVTLQMVVNGTYGKNVALATLPTASNATPTNRLRVIRCLCKLVSGFIVHEAGCDLDASVQSGELYSLFFWDPYEPGCCGSHQIQ